MFDREQLASTYQRVRARTLELCAPLTIEDQLVQPIADASPTKWHLAHTTWFFEDIVLDDLAFDPAFRTLFNSYYEAIGPRIERAAGCSRARRWGACTSTAPRSTAASCAPSPWTRSTPPRSRASSSACTTNSNTRS